MPLWAILYALLLLLSAIATIFLSGNKSPLYIGAELLSGLFSVLFFLFYYNVIPPPSSLLLPLLMLGFILFQEIWVNRKLYDMLSLENLSKEEQKLMLFIVPLFSILLLSPFIWIVLQLFKRYFLTI